MDIPVPLKEPNQQNYEEQSMAQTTTKKAHILLCASLMIRLNIDFTCETGAVGKFCENVYKLSHPHSHKI